MQCWGEFPTEKINKQWQTFSMPEKLQLSTTYYDCDDYEMTCTQKSENLLSPFDEEPCTFILILRSLALVCLTRFKSCWMRSTPGLRPCRQVGQTQWQLTRFKSCSGIPHGMWDSISSQSHGDPEETQSWTCSLCHIRKPGSAQPILEAHNIVSKIATSLARSKLRCSSM